MKTLFSLLLLTTITIAPVLAFEPTGELIFEDSFERSESQEEKDEPGNHWTTSSDRTAAGNKQVDLRDGALYIYTHKDANHATSVRQEFAFRDGTIGLRMLLEDETDSLNINVADLDEKTVHAGHLFKVILSPRDVRITDQKTGEMNLVLRKAKQAGTLSPESKKQVAAKTKRFPHTLQTKTWYQVHVTVDGDTLTCRINGEIIGTFQSEGFAHETKKLLRLLVAKNAYVDDVKIWRDQ